VKPDPRHTNQILLGAWVSNRPAGSVRGVSNDSPAHDQARVEALNNKVRLITRRAYGFHSAEAALALIHLTCGPLTLTLPDDQPPT
jgi:hypothetical protein